LEKKNIGAMGAMGTDEIGMGKMNIRTLSAIFARSLVIGSQLVQRLKPKIEAAKSRQASESEVLELPTGNRAD